jgi:hypothetical protein
MEGTITARFDIDGRIAWLIPVVLGIVLIIANGLAAFTYLQQLHRAVAQADHSLQVTLVLKEIEDLSEACGWSQRNYLLSGDAQYLDSYRRARMELPAQLERLNGLVADDSSQSGLLKSLRTLIERDMAELGANLAPLEAHFGDGRLPVEAAAGVARRMRSPQRSTQCWHMSTTCCATISSRSNRTTPSRSESAWSSEPAPSFWFSSSSS